VTTRRSLWPAELGPDTPWDRARVVARGYRDLAVKYAPPELIEATDQFAVRVGEGDWLFPTPVTYVEGEPLTAAQVAKLAGVAPPAVAMWGSRGIRRDGKTHHLKPGASGLYDFDDTHAFLRLRDTPATREKSA
jgi:hypothetical protein